MNSSHLKDEVIVIIDLIAASSQGYKHSYCRRREVGVQAVLSQFITFSGKQATALRNGHGLVGDFPGTEAARRTQENAWGRNKSLSSLNPNHRDEK